MAVMAACAVVGAFDFAMNGGAHPSELLEASKIGSGELKLTSLANGTDASGVTANVSDGAGASDGGSMLFIKDGSLAGLVVADIIIYLCGAVRVPSHQSYSPLNCCCPAFSTHADCTHGVKCFPCPDICGNCRNSARGRLSMVLR